jgi:hypothetical protein
MKNCHLKQYITTVIKHEIRKKGIEEKEKNVTTKNMKLFFLFYNNRKRTYGSSTSSPDSESAPMISKTKYF